MLVYNVWRIKLTQKRVRGCYMNDIQIHIMIGLLRIDGTVSVYNVT